MWKRQVINQHVTDAGIVLRDDERLSRVHVKQGGTLIGRVLFTEFDPMVTVVGDGCVVEHCHFEAH